MKLNYSLEFSPNKFSTVKKQLRSNGIRKAAINYFKTGVMDLNNINKFNHTTDFGFKRTFEELKGSKKPLFQQAMHSKEYGKRSKSVVSKQKLNNILSVMGINGAASPNGNNEAINMIDLVSDFHKPKSLKFKFLKNTLSLMDKISMKAGDSNKASSFKLHSDIMKVIMKRRRESDDSLHREQSGISEFIEMAASKKLKQNIDSDDVKSFSSNLNFDINHKKSRKLNIL